MALNSRITPCVLMDALAALKPSETIPTGLRPPAQGWRASAYLGASFKQIINRNAVVANVAWWTDGYGRNRVAVGNNLRTVTQGSSCLATLDFGMESRWDSPKACRDNPKGIVAFNPRLAQSAYLGFGFGNGNNANGVVAWRRRVEVLRDAGRQLRTFNPEKTGADRA
jgi:hypothetical protein